MYRPSAFAEDRLDVLHALMRAHPLATLISAGALGLEAALIPILIDPLGGDRGVLRAHLARANGQLDALRDGAEVLAIFQGPQAYVSPSWYAAKAEHGKVVPTWNYVVVQAWGRSRVIDDAPWLRAQVENLTRGQEEGRPKPWRVDDAPDDFIAAQLRGIVGVEIPIDRIEGKWKLSQNRLFADRQGVIDGLGPDDGVAALMRQDPTG